jgi:hypothetical protein
VASAPAAPADGAVLEPADASRLAVDFASAARLYGGSPEAAAADVEESIDPLGAVPGDATGEDAWLESAVLGPDEVDEEALAQAMAADELSDITSDEMAEFEADLLADGDPATADAPARADGLAAEPDQEQHR